jgi:hypothetical protein
MPLELNETFYDGYTDYVIRSFQIGHVDRGNNLCHDKFSIRKDDIPALFPDDTVYHEGPKKLTIRNQNYLVVCETPTENTHIEIYSSSVQTLQYVKHIIKANTSPAPPQVKWIFRDDGSHIQLPVDTETLPRTEFYPWLGKDLSQYYDEYMASRASVLVLIGPPGTGKTSFIKGLISHTGAGALISYNTNTLENDEIFANFMSGREKLMVLEDADSFLKSRSKTGNTIMHKFLNIADGLVSTRNKKIIFSTNLPSARDVDSALIRPGRCFDTLKFDLLNQSDCTRIDSEYTGEGNITLAELLCGVRNTITDRVGFL